MQAERRPTIDSEMDDGPWWPGSPHSVVDSECESRVAVIIWHHNHHVPFLFENGEFLD
jgi:hypothetical protein